jgi:excisionase family DNA binding protein
MNDPANPLLLSTSDAANLLGLHPSSVKRWADQGKLESERTSGGHRRFRLERLVQGARELGVSTFLDPFHPWEANVWNAIQAGVTKRDFTRLTSLALAWLRQGDTELIGKLFFEFGRREDIPFTDFLDEAISGFMARVGEEWLQGRLQVGEEHMATELILEALMRLRFAEEDARAPEPEAQDPRRVAVVGAAQGEHHDLGAQAIRAVLERSGWKVYYLGSNVPVQDFVSIQKAQTAALICISFSSGVMKPELVRAVETLIQHQDVRNPYALAMGGGIHGITTEDLPQGPFTSMTLASSAADFTEWLQGEFPTDDPEMIRRVA